MKSSAAGTSCGSAERRGGFEQPGPRKLAQTRGSPQPPRAQIRSQQSTGAKTSCKDEGGSASVPGRSGDRHPISRCGPPPTALGSPAYTEESTLFVFVLLPDFGKFLSCITKRRASLTAWSVGNAWAISSSSKTRLVPSLNLSAYLPWVPVLRSSPRSYSARRSSAFSSLDFLFICYSLSTGKLPCTDDADSVSAVSMRDHQNFPIIMTPFQFRGARPTTG